MKNDTVIHWSTYAMDDRYYLGMEYLSLKVKLQLSLCQRHICRALEREAQLGWPFENSSICLDSRIELVFQKQIGVR